MNRVPVLVSQPAIDDMAEAYFYIEQRSPQNALMVVNAFERVFEQLAVTPTIGHIHPEIDEDAIRFVPVKGFEVAYRFEGSSVSVIRVVHAARDYTKIDWK